MKNEPFGYWVEQKGAEPALLRKPAYIPEPSDLRKVTPLFTSPAPSEASADVVEVFAKAREELGSPDGRKYPSDRQAAKAALEMLTHLEKRILPLTPAPQANALREALREARCWVANSEHDEECELHPDYGPQNLENDNEEREQQALDAGGDERDVQYRSHPQDAVCTCERDKFLNRLDALTESQTDAD